MLPDIVLLGLILVNFGPLNIFPKIKPPISELIQANKIEKSIIFSHKKFEKKKKAEQKINTYITKNILNDIK